MYPYSSTLQKRGRGCTSVRRTCSIGIGAMRSSHSCLGVAAAVYQQKYNPSGVLCVPCVLHPPIDTESSLYCCHPFRKLEIQTKKAMALDDSQIAKQNFEAAKNFVKRGSLTADEKAILESFPPEVFCHTDPSVEKQTDKIKGLWLYQGKKEGEFNLLFYAINARNKDAVSIILPKSGVDWQNSSGSFIFLQTSVCYGKNMYIREIFFFELHTPTIETNIIEQFVKNFLSKDTRPFIWPSEIRAMTLWRLCLITVTFIFCSYTWEEVMRPDWPTRLLFPRNRISRIA